MSTKLPIGYSEEDFKLLSPEERAGMLELAQQEQIELGLAEEEDATGDGSAPVVAQATEQPPAAAQQPPVTTPAPTTTPAPAAELPPPAEQEEQRQRAEIAEMFGSANRTPVALPDWRAPADIDQRIAQAESRKAELAEQADAGDITVKEYNAAASKLDADIRDLDWQKRQAQMAYEAREFNFQRVAVPSFLAQHPEYSSRVRLKALDDLVREEQQLEINAGRDHHDPAILARAHAKLVAEFGGPAPKTSAESRPPMPPLLNGLPAADPEDVSQGEFAKLNQLDGEAFEDAFGRLSPAQRERYLQGG